MTGPRALAQDAGDRALVSVWYVAVTHQASPEPEVPYLVREGVELNYLSHSVAS